jgi:hypothetical protein
MLVGLPAQQQFTVAATACGKPTVLCRRPDGTTASWSPGPDPLASATATLRQLCAATPAGESIGLCGIGDGYLLQVLAHNPPALFMDKSQPVFLIEPEPQVVLQCLMIHDYSAPRGPIEQARFYWFVGPQWDVELSDVLLGDLLLACPTTSVAQGFGAEPIQARVREVLQAVMDWGAELGREADRYYRDVTVGHLADLFGPNPPRRPRVLLLTTRFSTVLQYSTRDSAAAFERLGWEARVLIEPTPHHRVLRAAIREALAEFKPDLVFQIDHLRHEHGDLFPETLPFACWIQDHMPHLATGDAGAQVGPLDYVLTDATATYVDKFGYPARQCVPLPKLAVIPAEAPEIRGAMAAPRGDSVCDDIVFVSNASHPPELMVEQALATFGRTAGARELISRCCRRMVETYEAGRSLPTYPSVCAVLHDTLAGLSLSLPTSDFDVLARWLTHPFNDALYRQQALCWAADAADGLGLTLALYGNGWDKHPQFHRFARGPVAYGDELRDLTRRSRINLQIVPYLCLHQRLLDGLLAGGFFLVREHPADVAPAGLLSLLEANPRNARPQSPAFEALLEDCRACLCTTGNEDVVAMVRDWQESGQLVAGEGPLPRLRDVTFTDAASLRERIVRFASDPDARREVASVQRRSVAERLTYDAGLRRVVRRISELLSGTAAESRQFPVPLRGVRAA